MNLREYVSGGNATFTLVSGKTGNRYTFRVRKPHRQGTMPTSIRFVSVRTGGEQNWSYLGTLHNSYFPTATFRVTDRSNYHPESEEARAFAWFWRNVDDLRGKVEFLPSGRCCCCGRELTTPESIAKGIGPECERLMAERRAA